MNIASVFQFPETLFDWLLNGARGTRALWVQPSASIPDHPRGIAPATAKGWFNDPYLRQAPAADLTIQVVPQAGDWVHAANQMRLLPTLSLEATSGGWVPEGYTLDPAPAIPAIFITQAQWGAPVGDPEWIVGEGAFLGIPEPGFGYPDILGQQGIVGG